MLPRIPVGVESGWHTHPGEEGRSLLAGTVEVSIEGRTPVVLQAGEGFLVPPRTPHNARDLGPGTGEMLSTYIVAVGEPLATLTGWSPGWNGRGRVLLTATVSPMASGRHVLVAMLVLIVCDVIGGFLAVFSGVNTWGEAWGFDTTFTVPLPVGGARARRLYRLR